MSLSSSAALKPGSNPSRNAASHGAAYEPYYGDMLDTIQHRSVDEAINLFSRRGYDVNVEVEYVFDDGKKYNVTPLHWAVRHRQPRLCKYLLEHGARPFSSLVFEYYPLHEACSRGYDDVLKVFIDCKVDLNRVTPDLDTPLHIAAMRGHIKCVHLLLDARADYSLRNKGGRTPVEEAMYQHQDDLIQLFKVYPDCSKDSTHDKSDGPRLKRRLSLGSRPPLRQQESSPAAVPCRRPKSVYLEPGSSFYEPAGVSQLLLNTSTSSLSAFAPATTRSHSHQNLSISPPIPPKSSAQPLHCVGSLSGAPSDHHYTPAKMPSTLSYSSYTSSGLLTQPTLATQLSIASSCVTDSPSPVEKDGVGRSLLDDRAHVSTSSCSSFPPKVSTVGSDPVRTSANRSLNSSPTKHVSRSDPQYSSGQYGTQSTSSRRPDTTPLVFVDSGRPHPRPHPPPVHLPVTSSSGCVNSGGSLTVMRHPSKLHYRLMESISNPEFPAVPEVMVSPDKRTQSSGDLFNRMLKSGIARVPHELQVVSPSRDKLNSLSHHIYSSFNEGVNQPATTLGYLKIYSGPSVYSDSGGDSATTSSFHPTLSIVQKILSELGQLLKFTPEQIQSIIDSASSQETRSSFPTSAVEYSNSRTSSSSSSYSFIDLPTNAGEIKPNAESFLSELQVDVEDQPFEVKFGAPASGYMTLCYRAKLRDGRSVHSRMEEVKENHILKVIFRVFNLMDRTESSEYHSLNTGATAVTTTTTIGLPSNFSSSFEHLSLSRPLQEVASLQKLSASPHPNVVQLVRHFRATTSDKYHMIARNINPSDPQAVYSASPTADYLLTQSTTTTLSKHFENLQKKHRGVVPEADVLIILAQLNLGISHLCANGISHCAINANNVYVNEGDGNRLMLANFSRSVQFSADLSKMSDVRSCLRSNLQSKTGNLNLCPEVVEWANELETDFSSYVQHDTQAIFAMNDSYSAAQMVYSLLVRDLHESFQSLDSRDCYGYPLPHISSLSPQCNHLLQKLVSRKVSERLGPMEAAVASLVLLFGPKPIQVHSIEDCHQWILAETMQLYMRPVLTDSHDSELSVPHKRLLYMYLIVAHKSPQLLWKLCSFFKRMSV